MAELQFEVHCDSTKPGEGVFVVGSAPEFGTWTAEKGVPCVTSSSTFPVWKSASVPIAKAGKLDFKVVIARNGGAGARWEDGDNKSVEVGAEKKTDKCELLLRGQQGGSGDI